MQVLSGAIPTIYRAHQSAVDEYPEYTILVRLHKTHLFNLFVPMPLYRLTSKFGDMPYDDLPYYHMMNHYPFLWTSLMWVLVVIVVAYLIYRLIKSEKILILGINPRSTEDILIERYAKGELTRDQFMQIKRDIKPDDT